MRGMKTDGLRPDIAAAAAALPSTLGSGREIRKLAEHLWDGETVQVLVAGQYAGAAGLLTLTDRRLLFTFDGPLKSVSEDFPLGRVSSIQWSSGVIFGKVVIFASGTKAEIANVDKNRGKALVDTARDRIGPEHPVPAPTPTPVETGDGIGDQLMKLAALRDAGVLSDQEFAAAKAHVLGL